MKILASQVDANTRNALQALFPGDGFIESQEFSILHRTDLGLNSLDLGTLLAGSLKSEVDRHDMSGRTALWWAIYRADLNATTLLLSNGADINKKSATGYSPIHTAIAINNPAVIRLILSRDCDMARDPQGWLPLHNYAFHGPSLEIFEMILARTMDVNSITSDGGSTAYMIAVQEGHHHFSEHLIDRGADIDKVNTDGESALHVAIQYNRPKLLDLILKKHANHVLKTKAGENILHYAAQFGDLNSLQILYAHDLSSLNIEDRVTGPSYRQRFKNMKNMDALDIANLRDDVSPEWHAMFRKLVNGIKYPESKLAETTSNDVDIDEFHDALEHIGP